MKPASNAFSALLYVLFGIRLPVALLAAALGAACSVEMPNTRPVRQPDRETLPGGDVRLGWRVFQQNCAGCHGSDATGTAKGPDLLPRVREMGSHKFTGLVLRKYEWIFAAGESDAAHVSDDPLTEKIVRGREGEVSMPAWQGNPVVTAHVEDLYAYLSARAEGTLPPGRP